MHLGLDLDNTLICYDESFVLTAKELGLVDADWRGGKKALRDHLRQKVESGEQAWQLLQGQVYGRRMSQAKMKPGAAWFLLLCKVRGIKVSIVSHKTEFSPSDPDKVPLRQVALDWMTDRGFFNSQRYGLSRESVFFEETRAEKIQRIRAIGCSCFVDDLLEVLSDKSFPNKVGRFLFDQNSDIRVLPTGVGVFSTWSEIADEIFGLESPTHLCALALGFLNRAGIEAGKVQACRRVPSGGNSQVYQVKALDQTKIALKRYPERIEPDRDRFHTEIRAARLLRQAGMTQTPLVVFEDSDARVALFQWADGSHEKHPTPAHIKSLVSFIRELDGLKRQRQWDSIDKATEACLNGEEICRQIRSRRESLSLAALESSDLGSFLENVFDPLFQRVNKAAHKKWPKTQSFDQNLEESYWTLSPSDFGLHNTLWNEKGEPQILDFEYFGWDDPTKLASDFCWHPGMNLNQALRQLWISEITTIFSVDPNFCNRLNAVHPLYGLRWAMIVLKPFLGIQKKFAASDSQLREQLAKAGKLCDRVRDSLTNPKPEF